MLHAVFDTNVLVSALLSSHDDAATVQVVVKLLAGEVTPLYSDDIFREYRDVLHRPKFRFDPAVVDDLLSAVHLFGLQVAPSPTGEELPDRKDLPFYEVVMEKREEGAYLITGNTKHFPKKRFVVTPAEFLEIIRKIVETVPAPASYRGGSSSPSPSGASPPRIFPKTAQAG